MTLEPGSKLGTYELGEQIGAGGMGAVFKAYQPGLGRFVAIKVLPPQVAGDPQFRQRFVVEALAVGKLRHPNICAAFDFAQQGPVAYLVSELVDGGTLAQQIGPPMPLEHAGRILGAVAAALDYAHSRGIVHRDVKPTNILLARDGTPVLTDFGLAKIVGPGSGATQTSAIMGTAQYIAPECVGGAEAGPAADQYALALIAYEMLVGVHPFPAENPLAALMANAHTAVPRPKTFGVNLPATTEAALMRALAKRPEERYPSASEFVRALAGPSVTAAAPARVTRRRWLAAPVLFAAALVALLIVAQPSPQATDAARLVSVSPPLTIDRGAQADCVVAYANDSGEAWVQGGATEVWLYLSETVTAPLRSWITDLGDGIIASQRAASIDPGQVAVFAFPIAVPADSTEQQANLTVYPINANGRAGADAICLVHVR